MRGYAIWRDRHRKSMIYSSENAQRAFEGAKEPHELMQGCRFLFKELAPGELFALEAEQAVSD
jgi:hypothetical protein